MERRQYLQRLGGAASLGLIAATAGCGGDGGNGGDTTTEGDGMTTDGDGMTTEPMETTTMGGGTTTTEPGGMTTIAEGSATVEIEGFAFKPVRLRVASGTTVEWVNKDSAAHTVVASDLTGNGADWSFDKEASGGGGTVSHTFESEGVYEYFCDIHGKTAMCGVVLVDGATLSADLPCE